ncbi:MAG: SRPBCC domain-containing protein, partial [Candidatus Binatia bacterium]
RPDGSVANELENQILLSFEQVGAATKMTFRLTGMPEGDVKDLMAEIWPQAFDKIAHALAKGG